MTNYEYLVDYVANVARISSQEGIRVLDFGCGAGQVVSMLRSIEIDGFGCDIFYGGVDYSGKLPKGYAGNIIKKIEDNGELPFPDSFFDIVVSNEVMEHVANIDQVLAEITRVLKPSGRFLSIFPSLEVWREGHCGVPFLHWFPPSRIRLYYACMMRSVGFGHNKNNKSIYQWANDYCNWLDQWTQYRRLSDIRREFSKCFNEISFLEVDYFNYRSQKYSWLKDWVPRYIKTLVIRRLAGLVLEARFPMKSTVFRIGQSSQTPLRESGAAANACL